MHVKLWVYNCFTEINYELQSLVCIYCRMLASSFKLPQTLINQQIDSYAINHNDCTRKIYVSNIHSANDSQRSGWRKMLKNYYNEDLRFSSFPNYISKYFGLEVYASPYEFFYSLSNNIHIQGIAVIPFQNQMFGVFYIRHRILILNFFLSLF